ncbi:MAG: T9SS type A sorting domain-containing protein, partial [Ferruginibacter sp.]
TANTATTAINNLTQGVYNYELTVTDNNGAKAKDTVQVIVNGAINQAPTANAGTDKTITFPANSTSLSGSGTDIDGTITGYAWVKIAGPASGTIATANSATTAINNLVQGVYSFELTVTDNNGATGKDTVQVTVNSAIILNKLPIANAGADVSIVLPTNIVSLKGAGSDPDGTIVSYRWRVISGPAGYAFQNVASNKTKIENLFQGIYFIEFAVIDDKGGIGTDTMTITVSSPRLSNNSSNSLKVYPNPVEDVANLSITAINSSAKLSISVTDLRGRIVKTTELLTSDNKALIKLNVSNLSKGFYIITLRFEDGSVISSKVIKQ